MRNISETPENWVVMKIVIAGQTTYKVFGSWRGGYLSGDYWRLNSGIKDVEEDDDYFYFNGFSGSCYKCNKEHYGIATTYCWSVFDSMIELGLSKGADVEIMDKDTNWLNLKSDANENV